jgi:hypothetical protein
MRSVLRSNPFLCLGVLGTLLLALFVVLGLQPHDGGIGQLLFHAWRLLAAPVHLAANLLAPVTDGWPDALDAAAAIVTGLLPYLLADWLVRRWRGRKPPKVASQDA